MKGSKRKLLSITFITCLAVAGFCVTNVFALGPSQFGLERGFQALDLTQEQLTQMQQLRKAYFEETYPLREQILERRMELRRLLLSEKPDEGKIMAVQREISDLHSKLAEKRTQLRLEISKMLTPEQKGKLLSFRVHKRLEHRGEK